MLQNENLRGAALMMAAMACYTINDTLMKSLSSQVPLNEQVFLRGMMTTAMLAVWLWLKGLLTQRPAVKDLPKLALRTLSEIGAAYFFITALFQMPLANVTAILQSLPLTVSLAAALFLGERIGWRRSLAIAVGMIGVLMIVQPGSDGFSYHTIYALIAVGCVTLRDILTRTLSGDTHSLWITFITAAGVTVYFGAAALTEPWVPVTSSLILPLFAASIAILGGYLFSVMVMRVGEISFVAPFRYTGLIWALILGFAVFGDWPDVYTLIGAAIVVSAGIFTLWREHRASSV